MGTNVVTLDLIPPPYRDHKIVIILSPDIVDSIQTIPLTLLKWQYREAIHTFKLCTTLLGSPSGTLKSTLLVDPTICLWTPHLTYLNTYICVCEMILEVPFSHFSGFPELINESPAFLHDTRLHNYYKVFLDYCYKSTLTKLPSKHPEIKNPWIGPYPDQC